MEQQEYAIYQLRRGESVYQSAVSRRLDKSDVIKKIVSLLCKSTNTERQYHNEKTKRTCAA